VQNFYPSPLANATTMYYTEKNPLNKVSREGGDVFVAKGERRRRLHKALLRYHDPAGWPMIREALLAMGKGHLIGNGPGCLVPAEGRNERAASGKGMKPALTRHSNIAHQRGNGGKVTSRRAASRWVLSCTKALTTANRPHRAKARVNQQGNPPTRVKPRPAQAPPSRVPNPLLRAASQRPKGMVPSVRRGDIPDWKAIEIKRRPDGRLLF